MAEKNMWQTLAKIREDFKKEELKKSGINLHSEFKYYELYDILPLATKVISKHKCIFVINFPDDRAEGSLIDLENPDNRIVFTSKTTEMKEPAKFRMNEIQALGASHTYMRRYIYYLLLDIAPQDEIDSDKHVMTQKKQPPPTSAKRQAIKKELTAPDGDADQMQIDALKKALKELKELDPGQEEFIQEIAMRTNGFTDISKSACENLIVVAGEMIEHIKGGK